MSRVLVLQIRWFVWTCLFLALMSILRLLMVGIYWNQINQDQSISVIFKIFFQGFRFDLLVWGFFWIPIFFVIWISYWIFANHKKYLTYLAELGRIYFSVLSALLAMIYFLDYFHFERNLDRITYFDWRLQGFVASFSWSAVFFVTLLFGGLLAIEYIMLLKGRPFFRNFELKINNWSRGKKIGVIFLQFLMIALAARGTVTAHHLNIEHSFISNNSTTNELVLNPVWNWDK